MVSFSAELLDHIHGTDVFSDEVVESILDERITAPINGFQTSDYPLWKLGTLLHKNYVNEEVINSLTELLYLRHGANTPSGEPSVIIPPTFFFGLPIMMVTSLVQM